MSKTSSKAAEQAQLIKQSESERPLGKYNFYGMIAAGVLIVVGFLLMLGGSSTTEEFNPDIFSTRRIIVGPMLAFLGFVLMAVAIILSPRRRAAASADQTTETTEE